MVLKVISITAARTAAVATIHHFGDAGSQPSSGKLCAFHVRQIDETFTNQPLTS